MFLHPKPFVEYCIDFIAKSYDLVNPNEKQKALGEINEYFKNLKPLEQETYASYASTKLGTTPKHIISVIEK